MDWPVVIVSVLALLAVRFLSLILLISTSDVTEVHAGAQMVVATLGLGQDAA